MSEQAAPSSGGFSVVTAETVYEGWMRVRRIEVRRSDGSRLTAEVEDHGDAACVLAYDSERRTVLLVRQFRVPPFVTEGAIETLEVVAGIVEDGSPDACARREALEEAGVVLRELEHVATVWSSPGVSAERMHLYLAPYRRADRVSEGGGVAGEGERISVDEMPADALAAAVRSGAIDDMKTLALAQALMLRHAGLFRS